MLTNILVFYNAHRTAYKLLVLIILFSSFYCILKTNEYHPHSPGSQGNIILNSQLSGNKQFLLSLLLTDTNNHSHSLLTVSLTEDDPAAFAAVMKKPFSSLSAEEVQFFLTYKESQYAIRRKRIEDFCSIQDENFGRKIIKNSLIFDKGSLKTFGSLFIISIASYPFSFQ